MPSKNTFFVIVTLLGVQFVCVVMTLGTLCGIYLANRDNITSTRTVCITSIVY
jgi:hypothetical protein